MKIAFLGLGRMGRELAAHLVEDGHDVTVWNRTAAATTDLVQRGARAAADPAEAVAGAELIIDVLFGPDAVRDVVIDTDLPIRAGAVWLNVTTVGPADADSFAAWAAHRGVKYVHGPIIGSLAPARARKLSILLGSDNPAALDTAKGIAIWADPDRIRTFDAPAKAATGKLIANLTLAVGIEGLIEALRLGHSNALTTDEVLGTLDLTTLAPIKTLKASMIRDDSFGDTQFSVALLAKDIRLMLASTTDDLPTGITVLEALNAAIIEGHGEDDFAVIAAADR